MSSRNINDYEEYLGRHKKDKREHTGGCMSHKQNVKNCDNLLKFKVYKVFIQAPLC